MAKEKIFWEVIDIPGGLRSIADEYERALRWIRLRPMVKLVEVLILLAIGMLLFFGNYLVSRVWWNEFAIFVLIIVGVCLILPVCNYFSESNKKRWAVKAVVDPAKRLFYDFVVFVDEVNVPISNLAEDMDFYVVEYHERARKLFLLVGKIKIMGKNMFVLSEENRGEFEKRLCELKNEWEEAQE